jgi:hypothetical protein
VGAKGPPGLLSDGGKLTDGGSGDIEGGILLAVASVDRDGFGAHEGRETGERGDVQIPAIGSDASGVSDGRGYLAGFLSLRVSALSSGAFRVLLDRASGEPRQFLVCRILDGAKDALPGDVPRIGQVSRMLNESGA